MNCPASVFVLSAIRANLRSGQVLDGPASDKTTGIDNIDHWNLFQLEDRGIEKCPCQHLLIFHRLRKVVDCLGPTVRMRGSRPSRPPPLQAVAL